MGIQDTRLRAGFSPLQTPLVGRQSTPGDTPETLPQTEVQTQEAPAGVTDQTDVRLDLASEEAATGAVQTSLDAVENAAAELPADPDALARFQQGELPATPAAPETVTALRAQSTQAREQLGQTAAALAGMMDDTHHAAARDRGDRQDIPAAREALKAQLMGQREALQTQMANLDPVADAALLTELQTTVSQLEAGERLIDQAGTLDAARRDLLDANYGTDARGRVRSDAELNTEITARLERFETAARGFEDALALVEAREGQGVMDAEQTGAFLQVSAEARRSVDQFRSFIFEPNANTLQMMRQLGRGGTTLRSRFQGYHGFIDKRLSDQRSGRPRTPTFETFNVRGYGNSLQHDLNDSRVFLRRFQGVLGEMEQRARAGNPMPQAELNQRVRAIYSTESGDPFVRNAVIQATTNVAEARRLTQVAEGQISAASQLLQSARGELAGAASDRDVELFDQARARVAQARQDARGAVGHADQATALSQQSDGYNQRSLNVLPPTMQQGLQGDRQATAGRNVGVRAQADGIRTEAVGLVTEAGQMEAGITDAEQAARDRARNGEQLAGFMQRLENLAPGSEAGLELSLGIRVGTSAGRRVGASATVRGLVGITAEKSTGLGGTYTLRVNYGFEGELRAQLFNLSGSAKYTRMFSDGVSFYRPEQAQQFAQMTTDFFQTLADQGVTSDATGQAWSRLTQFVDQNSYSGNTHTTTVTGSFRDSQVQFQYETGTHTYDTFDDRPGTNGRSNGLLDADENQLTERISADTYRGSFQTTLRGSQVRVMVDYTSAQMLERQVQTPGGTRRSDPAATQESTSNSRVRVVISPQLLRSASDQDLEQLLIDAQTTVPGSRPQMRFNGSFKDAIAQARTQARSSSSSEGIVLELARSRDVQGNYRTVFRTGVHQESAGEVGLPTVNPAVQVVGGYNQHFTLIRDLVVLEGQ